MVIMAQYAQLNIYIVQKTKLPLKPNLLGLRQRWGKKTQNS